MTGCQTLEVTNGTLTDDADGFFSLSTGGGGGNSFETIAVPAGASVVADAATDTLTLTETTFLTFTGTAATDTIDVTQVTTDIGTDGLIAANAVALTTDTTGNYVATVADGAGIDGTASAEGATYTPSVDTTEIGATTWSNGAAGFTWTFDAGVVDNPTLTFYGTDGTVEIADRLFVNADTGDEIVFQVQGGTTQTSDLVVFENFSGSDQFTFSNTGNLVATGDLTVTGGDLTLGTTSIFSGGDTASLNNVDAVDATTETTIEAAMDTLANLTAASALATVGTITSGTWNAGAVTSSGLLTGNSHLQIGNGATTAGIIAIREDTDAGTNEATFTVPALAADTDYTLPADDGTDATTELLTTNGAGTLDWITCATLTGSADLCDGTDATGAGGGDPVLIDGVAVTDAAGVDFIGGTGGIDITYNAAASPDTATLEIDGSEISSIEFGNNNFTTMTFSAGAVDPVITVASGSLTVSTGTFTTSALLTASASLDVKNGASAAVMSLYEASGSGTNFASLQVPALTANTVYTLPADDGDAGEQLQTNGSGTLSWEAAGSGTDTNAVKEYQFPCPAMLPLKTNDAIPPIIKDAGTNVDQLVCGFDTTADEARTGVFKVPVDVTSGTVTFRAYWYAPAATSGTVLWDFQHNSGVAEGVDPDQALTSVLATADDAQGTAGMITITSWTETIANLGWVAGDLVNFQLMRDVSGDDLAEDAYLSLFVIEVPRA